MKVTVYLKSGGYVEGELIKKEPQGYEIRGNIKGIMDEMEGVLIFIPFSNILFVIVEEE